MGHYLINTSWHCQLTCPYCLLPHIKINRAAPEHSWSEWAVALRDHTEPGSIIDFAGGDPLLFPGLARLCAYLHETGRRWAITTNAIDDHGTNELLRLRPGGCVLVNVSVHPGNGGPAVRRNVERLRDAFPLVRNVVAHPQAGQTDERIASVIPYQSWREGTELDGIRRWCDSGLHHFVADPGGDVFRCNPAMATAMAPMGNLFRRTVAIPEPTICEMGCSTCYTSVPDAWPVTMRAI